MNTIRWLAAATLALTLAACAADAWNKHIIAGQHGFNGGRYDLAEVSWTRALREAEARGDPRLEAKSLNNLGNAYRMQHRYDEAEAALTRAAALAETSMAAHPDEQARILRNLGDFYASRDRQAEAKEARSRAARLRSKQEPGHRTEPAAGETSNAAAR